MQIFILITHKICYNIYDDNNGLIWFTYQQPLNINPSLLSHALFTSSLDHVPLGSKPPLGILLAAANNLK